MHIQLFLRKKMAAECIGTFAMVFAGCGAVMLHTLYPETLAAGAVPVVFGLSVAAMIYAVGHISGAHFNPAVTLAFTLVGRFPRKEVPFYWLAQSAGAVLAIGLLAATLPEVSAYGATLPTIPAASALVWEMLLSFLLMFVIIAVATDSRAVGTMAGAAIGATVMVDAFIGGALTGASMNPVRSFAPALFSGNLQPMWLYVAGPCLGMALAAITYEWVRCETEDPKPHAGGCC